VRQRHILLRIRSTSRELQLLQRRRRLQHRGRARPNHNRRPRPYAHCDANYHAHRGSAYDAVNVHHQTGSNDPCCQEERTLTWCSDRYRRWSGSWYRCGYNWWSHSMFSARPTVRFSGADFCATSPADIHTPSQGRYAGNLQSALWRWEPPHGR
jgi:hypothetical protein